MLSCKQKYKTVAEWLGSIGQNHKMLKPYQKYKF